MLKSEETLRMDFQVFFILEIGKLNESAGIRIPYSQGILSATDPCIILDRPSDFCILCYGFGGRAVGDGDGSEG